MNQTEETLFVLMRGQFPVAISNSEETLKQKRDEMMRQTEKDVELEVIHRTENSITYHTGTSYLTDEYTIFKVPVVQ